MSFVETPADSVLATAHWYAVHTRANHENRVFEQLRACQVECFLPAYRSLRRWRNRCRVLLEMPLFPGYLFVHIAAAQRLRVIRVPSVVSIVGNGHELLPLPDFEIERLRAGLHLRRAEPHPFLVVGQRAQIIAGPLAGLEGIVLRKKNRLRVVLTVELIMKSVAVEVDGSELEPLPFSRPLAPLAQLSALSA